MKTLILSSSLSENSRSFILCKEAYEKLKSMDIDVTLVDAKDLDLKPYHLGPTKDMENLANKISISDNIIIGIGIHNYTISDGLKIILSGCFNGAEGKFFGILCTAGGERSYLSTMHLTQICMNEWRMIQLPQIVYALKRDFENNKIINKNVIERIDLFCKDFKKIGEKLL